MHPRVEVILTTLTTVEPDVDLCFIGHIYQRQMEAGMAVVFEDGGRRAWLVNSNTGQVQEASREQRIAWLGPRQLRESQQAGIAGPFDVADLAQRATSSPSP